VVLGGIAVGPAVLVGGFVLAHQGEKAKTKAVEYAGEVDRKVAQIDAAVALLSQAECRIEELSDVIAQLDERATGAIERLWSLDGAFDFSNDDHIRRFATAMQLTKALSELMRVEIFNDEGGVNQQTEQLIAQQWRLLSEIAP
jgi:hypothetical protein